ncbi:MAG TPA: hypothetical protein PK059_13730 [Cyclobacteriaceae bacterium]|nr:hypothetical protein [Cyclobacteriaceae bacterium]
MSAPIHVFKSVHICGKLLFTNCMFSIKGLSALVSHLLLKSYFVVGCWKQSL